MTKCIRSGSSTRRRVSGSAGIPGGTDAGGRGPSQDRPHERLLRVGRDLMREVASGAEPSLLVQSAVEQIRTAGGYRSVRYLSGEGPAPRDVLGDPSVVVITVGVNSRQHGLLVIETDPRRPPDAAERSLLEECADDLALALHLETIEEARRQTLVRILESEERFRQVFHQTNDAILLYEVDRDGRGHRCLEANEQACRWLGYSQDELRLCRPEDLIVRPATAGPPPWERTDAGPFRFDAAVRRRDGVTAAVISLHRFNLLGRQVMLVVARDVAEERQREREQMESLRQIQKNMEQFQILNDQIRNPVQVIIGLADMEAGDVGGRIIQQAHEIDAIVRQLDIGWLESAKVTAYLRRYGT